MSEVTAQDIRQLKEDMYELKTGFEEVRTCIVGSSLSKDGGLVKRVDNFEEKQSKLEAKVDDIVNNSYKSEFYLKVIYGLCGSLLGTIFTSFVYYHFKK